MPRKPKKKFENGPVAVVENRGVKIPIYLEPLRGKTSYIFPFWVLGKRKRCRRGTLEEAKKEAWKKTEELSNGTAHAGTFTMRETEAINQAIEILEPIDVGITEAARRVADAENLLQGRGTIEEAVKMLLAFKAKQELPPIKFGDLHKEFMGTLMTQPDPTNIKSRVFHRSMRYWQDCSQRLGAAAVIFKNKLITDITTRDLEGLLDKMPARRMTKDGVIFEGEEKKITGVNRNKYRAAFCTIFSFARKRGYLPRGVETEAEHVLIVADNKTTTQKAEQLQRRIYTPAEMQTILDQLPDRWITFVVLGAFAGIRASEIHRLDWADVDFEQKVIVVEKHKAKVGRRRVIPMSEQLEAWLAPLAQDKGWVCPHFSHDSTLNIEFTKVRSQIPVETVHNGHRHSYASYRLAEIKNEHQVALEMNTSPRKLRDNYLALVNASQLEEWKRVLPPC